jgi:hypothetical protein
VGAAARVVDRRDGFLALLLLCHLLVAHRARRAALGAGAGDALGRIARASGKEQGCERHQRDWVHPQAVMVRLLFFLDRNSARADVDLHSLRLLAILVELITKHRNDNDKRADEHVEHVPAEP